MKQGLWGLALLVIGFLLLARAVIINVDWSLLLVFMVMFIDVHLLIQLPVLHQLLSSVGQLSPGGLWLTAIGLSQFISNVPATILLLNYVPPSTLLAWAVKRRRLWPASRLAGQPDCPAHGGGQAYLVALSSLLSADAAVGGAGGLRHPTLRVLIFRGLGKKRTGSPHSHSCGREYNYSADVNYPDEESPMRYKKLGNTGLFVSELCLGTMTFGGEEGMWGKIGQLRQAEAEQLVGSALDAGINFIDTANVYSEGRSEEITGQALKNLKIPRENVVVATKVFGETGTAGVNSRGSSRYPYSQQRQKRACGACSSIISISISCTASTRRHPSKRPSTPSIPWSARGTSAISAYRTGPPGKSSRRWVLLNALGWPALPPCRLTTPLPGATSSASWCR
ncbi:Inner membrane protein YbiR [Raoultella terrigena]|uniref:Inner membrane protein YbiR n=2 Tax=Klebsiella/Raoultella group TaxID=2890311 RepID=A0A485BJS2_RAOTE|nr:Inner membrane protein YbiR [Raoultella terrigena]